MFLEVSGKRGENRVRSVLLILGLGEGQAHAPDRLANALGFLERLINGAVLYLGQKCLKLRQFLLGGFPILIGRIVALDGCPEPGHLPEVMPGGLRIVECGGTLLDRGLALDPGEQLQGMDRLAGMLEVVVHEVHPSSVNERSRRAVVGKCPGTLTFLQREAALVSALGRWPVTGLAGGKGVPFENALDRCQLLGRCPGKDQHQLAKKGFSHHSCHPYGGKPKCPIWVFSLPKAP